MSLSLVIVVPELLGWGLERKSFFQCGCVAAHNSNFVWSCGASPELCYQLLVSRIAALPLLFF